MTSGNERSFPRGRDAMRAPEVERIPPTSGGRAFYLVAGVMIAIVLSAGLLFYNPGDRIDQARQHDRLPILQK